MPLSEDVLDKIYKKVELYDNAREKIEMRICNNIQKAVEKLRSIESALLYEAEQEFRCNPFASFLVMNESDKNFTDDDVSYLLSQKIPDDFGPSEESFHSLFREIDSFYKKRDKPGLPGLVPKKLTCTGATCNSISLSWEKIDNNRSYYEVQIKPSTANAWKTYNTLKPEITIPRLTPATEYHIRVRVVPSPDEKWGEPIMVRTEQKFSECGWKECPDDVDDSMKYAVDGGPPRIATNIECECCTIIGDIPVPLNKVTSWSVKVLKSKYNNGGNIYVGIAPPDINQNDYDNYEKYGWYLDCYHSVLWSGPPHSYSNKEYGPRKEKGEQYVHTGDSVGVVMDTAKSKLSFVLNGVGLGVAYEGIPLDKPLVPCVLLLWQGDSIELDPSEVKETEVDNSIPVPSNITAKSGITWDSITLTWDKVESASFYQIEVDGSKTWDASTTNSSTKRGLLPETEHSFRVRTVRGSSVSEWCGIIKGKTSKESLEKSWWKKCTDNIVIDKTYLVDENNPRIATKNNGGSYMSCTIIGNTHIPLNTVVSWEIKVLNSKNNNGWCICVGVAPFDIDQNGFYNYRKCGWHFDCGDSVLWSGPPHNYREKEYVSIKSNGEYVHTGDSVGVLMDTTKGDLSFILNGVNLGAAFEGIPLDKPLVPCIILAYEGDSVEFGTPEVKENVDTSISVPSNVIIENTTWDSITLTWDKVSDASFYQIEVDESKLWYASTTNSFTKRGLLPETEYCFRVRTVREKSVSGWSDVVRGRTPKKSFETSVWKECPDDVDDDSKYALDKKNPRIATKFFAHNCTIIGNTHIPLNTVTSWSVKILKSKDNDGSSIYIGVAPNYINQNDGNNYYKCGWYFYCGSSSLYSGPPHNYDGKEYGPRKESSGQYVHTGDSVGVVVDTTRGDLSFVLNRADRCVAYCGIPLDEPLVPCVIIGVDGDSVELDTSEVKEKVDSSIPIPSNIVAKGSVCGTITLTWDEVADASSYQIEVDGSNFGDASTTNSFTKNSLILYTEHGFRVRTVRGGSVSKWSDVVKRTICQSIKARGWKKCLDNVGNKRKYVVDEKNPQVATKLNDGGLCAIIGDTSIPLNKISFWRIKILKSKNNDGSGIYIGIAQNDINKNKKRSPDKCGWYFYCLDSTLRSGPPHNCNGKAYGPRKKKGQYVHTGDFISVVIDTIKGELSFVLNNVNLGVAYEGIPLDKPLVPCVLLENKGDSVRYLAI